MLLGVIFKIAMFERLEWFFLQQSQNILNVFNTLTLKQIFIKLKIIFKKLE